MKTKMLTLFLFLVLGIGVAFCSGGTPETSSAVTGENESPELAEKVAAGELPPLKDRLPDEPLIVEPVEEIGQYGGVWRQAHMGAKDIHQESYYMMEHLAVYSYDYNRLLPNIAKDWEFSEDSKSVTIFLRKGIKWSDGLPFTADDYVFWWNDVALNEDITPAPPNWMVVGEEPGRIEKIDDYTFKLSFAEPFGMILVYLLPSNQVPYACKHYLEQFHPKYTQMAKIEEAMKKEGFDVWTDLFLAESQHFNNPGCPQIDAWIPQNSIDEPIQTFVRNPYYWKVDTEGNQLPYIDKIERILVSDKEAILLKAVAGELDMQARNLTGMANYTLLMENREKGDYRIVSSPFSQTNLGTTWVNMFHEDPAIRELFRNKQFRIALSIAINREEINQLLFKGLGKLEQPFPDESTTWYNEEWCKMYTEYDPQKANQILDEIGLTNRDNEGYRLWPDGKRISFVNIILSWLETPELAELTKGYWKAIGIDVVAKPIETKLWLERVTGANFEIASYAANMGFIGSPPMKRGDTVPTSAYSYWAPMWGLWFQTSGESGEEPPEEVKRLMKIRDQILGEPDLAKRIELNKQLLAIQAENFWHIGVIRMPDFGGTLVKNYFRNVPDPNSKARIDAFQYFIKQ